MPTLTEMHMRPRPGYGKAAFLLLFVALAAGLASVVLAIARGRLTTQSVPDLILGIVVVLAVVAVVVLENKRAHSVELTEEAVSSLTWRFALGFFPYQLVPIRMRWNELQKIGRKGFSVTLKGVAGEVLVNTYLFDDPAKVIDFINEQMAKVAKENI